MCQPFDHPAENTMATIVMQTLPPPTMELVLPSKPLHLEDLSFLEKLGTTNGDTVTLQRSLRGSKLKTSVKFSVEKLLSLGQKGLAEYIISSLIGQRPILIPWVLENRSIIAFARYMLRSRSGSLMGFYSYSNTVNIYCRRLDTSPDAIIEDVKADNTRIAKHQGFLDQCIAELQDRDPPTSPGRIAGYVRQIRTFYRVNGVEIPKPQLPRIRVVRKDRAPRQEELQRVLDIADIRGKMIVSCLALGGFREGTLAQLRYHHVKEDLDKGRVPLHIHADFDIVKGKYGDYDTFLNQEAVDYLKLYLETRKTGTRPQWRHGQQVEYMPPEQFNDDTPLIRDSRSPEPTPIGEKQIYKLVHDLYHKAGLLKRGERGGYDLRPHSLRKFFKTQMKAAGVEGDYIDYMMGHIVDTYHDVQSRGVEFLRNIYAKSQLCIRPQPQRQDMEMVKRVLKELSTRIGREAAKTLVQETFAEPQMAYISNEERDNIEIQQLLRKIIHDIRQPTKTTAPENLELVVNQR